MDLRHSPEHEAFRAEVRAFLRSAWPPAGDEASLPEERQHALFRERAVARGYLYRDIPRAYGGSEQPADAIRDAILLEEFAASGVPGSLPSMGPAMLAPTLLEWGSDEQRRRFIPPTLAHEIAWCQGYSEPNAGSDLASLQEPRGARRRRVGDPGPQGLDEPRGAGGLDVRALPHRARGAEARGHLVSARADATARRARARRFAR